jgi:4-hydroxybenzoate polyprenyltransferase
VQTITLINGGQTSRALGVFAKDIKLSHSIFALPFVGVALTLTGVNGVSVAQLARVVICMIFARSFAMGMNRYLDRGFDATNERTRTRALPSGLVSSRFYLAITLVFGALFIAAAFSLSQLAGSLSPLLLVVLAFYSMMKRISWLTHWYLGFCLGLAPVAAEIALFSRVSVSVAFVGVAVAFWTAGFDLLYSLQDKNFDMSNGLHSVPAKFGHQAAIWLSRVSFIAMIICLVVAGNAAMSDFYWDLGVVAVGLVLFYEHWLTRDAMVAGTSARINVAFFNLNALVSILFFLFALADAYVQRT